MNNKTGNSYFDKIKQMDITIKIMAGIIVLMILLNLVIVKGLLSVANNKTVVIEVPNVLDKGEYYIGADQASPNVYKMWARVWIDTIANFSYKNVDKKFSVIYPFLDPESAYENKSNIIKFIEFVKKNFISQKFQVMDIKVKPINKKYTEVIVTGKLFRKIGNSKDELSGIRYVYKFIAYVKNGQIYIKSMKTAFFGNLSGYELKKIKTNKYINFDETIQ